MDVQRLKQKYSRKHLAGVTGLMLVVLILYFVAGVGASNAPTESQASQVCEDRCSEVKEATGQRQDSSIYDYCKDTFNIKTSPLSGSQLKEAETEYCTDNARCSNIQSCEVEEVGNLNMGTCIEFMNNYHQENLGEAQQEAEQHTEDLLSKENEEAGVGSCSPKPEWYQSNFGDTE